jgi:hypothetical protein
MGNPKPDVSQDVTAERDSYVAGRDITTHGNYAAPGATVGIQGETVILHGSIVFGADGGMRIEGQ